MIHLLVIHAKSWGRRLVCKEEIIAWECGLVNAGCQHGHQ
jgi:hypothetical protein